MEDTDKEKNKKFKLEVKDLLIFLASGAFAKLQGLW